jgi:hypothetical protein
MNCIEMNMEYICNLLGKDFKKMFIDSWDFYYKPDENNFMPNNLSFRPFKKLRLETNQLRHLGLEAKEIDVEHLLGIETINQYIESHKALLINLDSFECPWHRGYLKTHIGHYCLIIGYFNECYICIDPYLMGSDFVSLTYMQLKTGSELIYYNNSKIEVDLTIENLFNETIHGENDKSKMFDMMNLFLQQLSELTEASQLFDYPEDVYLCTITRATKFIADGRIKFGYLVENISALNHNYEIINSICSSLYCLGDLWNHLNSIFIKVYCAPKQFGKAKIKIIDYMLKIIDTEKNIYRTIAKFLEEKI